MTCCAPQNVPFYASRNTAFVKNIVVTKAGEAFDFTGWSARMQVRLEQGAAGAALIDVSTTANAFGSLITFQDNVIFLVIEQPDLANLPGASDEDFIGVYDIVLYDPSNRPCPFFGGSFVVKPGVTR